MSGKNTALRVQLSADISVNDLTVNQFSSELNRLHGQAIGREFQNEIKIEVSQTGSGDPSPENIRRLVSYNIDGIGAIYGGELNTATGVLTVTWGAVDMGGLTYGYSGSGPNFYGTVSGKKAGNFNMLCEKYKVTDSSSIAGMLNNQIKGNANNATVYIKDSAYTTAAAFKTASGGVLLAYELATPVEYTLTMQQMIQLLDQL